MDDGYRWYYITFIVTSSVFFVISIFRLFVLLMTGVYDDYGKVNRRMMVAFPIDFFLYAVGKLFFFLLWFEDSSFDTRTRWSVILQGFPGYFAASVLSLVAYFWYSISLSVKDGSRGIHRTRVAFILLNGLMFIAVIVIYWFLFTVKGEDLRRLHYIEAGFALFRDFVVFVVMLHSAFRSAITTSRDLEFSYTLRSKIKFRILFVACLCAGLLLIQGIMITMTVLLTKRPDRGKRNLTLKFMGDFLFMLLPMFVLWLTFTIQIPSSRKRREDVHDLETRLVE